ncbi:MAG: thermonuclease family protein [Boseongicola sp. SB0673_bin_14]|nr:thermonuclease family protein [Boseongicola sp. SB0673_bin_14]
MTGSRSFPCRIERVVDGDTIDVIVDQGFHTFRDVRVRLAGIDAPETRTRDLEEKERGLTTKARVEALCPVGSEHTLRSDEIGKFGRCIGDIQLDKEPGQPHSWLTEVLLCEGLVKPYAGGARS